MNTNYKRANQRYQEARSRLLTNAIVGEPSIDGYGFSARIDDFAEGEKGSFTLEVKAGGEAALTKDSATLITAALLLEKYRNVLFNYDVGEKTLEEARLLIRGAVNADTVRQDEPRAERPNMSVNLSGGVDSTALALLCPGALRMTVDFYAKTEDEAAGKPVWEGAGGLAVKTNASEFLFPHYSIGYHNLASLVYADTEGIGFALDGKLMTDSLISNLQFLEGKTQAVHTGTVSGVYGVTVLYPLAGMTRAGAQKILYNLDPALYQQMMAAYSQITPTAKRTFKLLIQNAVTGTGPEGQLTGFEFHTPYLVKKLGPGVMADSVDGAKLQELEEIIAPLGLGFYEKYDRNALRNIPEDFAAYFLERLEAAGIGLYADEDYAERAAVMRWLAEKEET